MQTPAGVVEQLVGGVHRVVGHLGGFLQQHLAFAPDLGLREGGVLHDVGQHAHERCGVLAAAAHVVGGVVLVGVGVDLGAQALGVEVDAVHVAPHRALEHHVLDEVADGVERARLVRAAGTHEDADAGGLQLRQRDGDAAHAVGQGVDRGFGIGARGAGFGHAGSWQRWRCEASRSSQAAARRPVAPWRGRAPRVDARRRPRPEPA